MRERNDNLIQIVISFFSIAVWDFWSLSPESLHQVTYLMGDRGIPATLRHMNGYGSHTFKWVNENGEVIWVKYHFKTEQGVKNMSNDVAAKLAGENPAITRAFPISGVAESVSYDHNDHYTQAGDIYRLMTEDERARLVETVVGAMKPVEREDIKLRQIQHFYKADEEYGERIAKGLGLAISQEVK